MQCRICGIASRKLIDEIEIALLEGQGIITQTTLAKLIKLFPSYQKNLEALTNQDCLMHFNFHQKITRVRRSTPAPITSPTNSAVSDEAPDLSQGENDLNTSVNRTRIADDIGKDEAEILYEMLNAQAATFNAVSNQINDVLSNRDVSSTVLMIHPSVAEFYKDTAASMRMTVKEIRELNSELNGKKDGALDGLKALALAIRGPVESNDNASDPRGEKDTDDMTTKDFD